MSRWRRHARCCCSFLPSSTVRLTLVRFHALRAATRLLTRRLPQSARPRRAQHVLFSLPTTPLSLSLSPPVQQFNAAKGPPVEFLRVATAVLRAVQGAEWCALAHAQSHSKQVSRASERLHEAASPLNALTHRNHNGKAVSPFLSLCSNEEGEAATCKPITAHRPNWCGYM